METVRTVLEELRRGKAFIVKVTRAGNKYRYYPYLTIPDELIARYGETYEIKLGEGYVDYIADPKGRYRVTKVTKSAYRIRFPVDVYGHVLIELHEWGFRVIY